MKKTIIATVLNLAVVAFIGTASSSAFATTGVKGSCTVTQISYDQHLYVQCASDATSYFAYLTSDKPNCTAPTTVTLDTIKLWESMIMAAFLAGKTVDLYWVKAATSCADTSTTFIYNVAVH